VDKKIIVTGLIAVLLILGLSACGGSAEEVVSDAGINKSSGVETSAEEAEIAPGDRAGFSGDMPISSQLGFGTLLLEETGNAVDPAQALQLLPLWKAARSLSQSETVAEEELNAIFNQIEGTMTTAQINAIIEMQLTGEEIDQRMEDLGIEAGFGGVGFGNLTPEQQATAQAAHESGEGVPAGSGPGGGFRGNGPGAGGGQGFDIGNLTPEQQATIEARRAERSGAGSRLALVFVDPLIELLEERSSE
jgi:hypothetical protein